MSTPEPAPVSVTLTDIQKNTLLNLVNANVQLHKQNINRLQVNVNFLQSLTSTISSGVIHDPVGFAENVMRTMKLSV